jgi:signal transduction histidine kinase
MTFAISLWCFGQFMGEVSLDKSSVLIWTRINLAGGILVLVFYVNFIAAFLKKLTAHKFFIAGAYFCGALLLFLDTTALFVSDVRPTLMFKFYPVPGPAYPLLMVFYVFAVSYGLIGLFRALLTEKGVFRNQIMYIFLSSVIGFVGASTLFLLIYGIKIYPFGYYLILCYILLGVYAIVRHRLMDITVVIRRGLVYSIMAAILSVLYIGSVFLTGALFQTLTGLRSVIPMILVLFAFAATFNPLREKLQNGIDRTFFKSRYDFARTIADISKKLSFILDLDELLDDVLSEVLRTVKTDAGSVFIRGTDRKFRLAKSFGFVGSEPTIDALAQLLQKKQTAVLIQDVTDQNVLSEMEGILSEVSIPLFIKGQLIGILNLAGKFSGDSYSDEDIGLLLTLGNQLAVAIENASLHEQIVSKERELFRSDKLASLGTLSAGMAHEIKNPLAIMKGLAQALPENMNNKEYLKRLSDVVPRQLDRINGLVEDLIAFSKPKNIEKSEIDVNKVILNVLRLVEAECKKRGIESHVDLDKNGLRMMADGELLTQAFLNLLLNAVQSMEGGGRLTVSSAHPACRQGRFTEKGRVRAKIKIADTGRGISEGDLPKIFDPFFTTKDKGAGLGLAVTQRIIKEHGGEIEVQSSLNKGTTFSIQL